MHNKQRDTHLFHVPPIKLTPKLGKLSKYKFGMILVLIFVYYLVDKSLTFDEMY